MAVSTYTTNLTDIYAGAGSTTGWSALGGGASGLNAETDYYIQGTGMTSKNAFASTRKGMIYNGGSDFASTIGLDGAVLIWTTHATPNSVDLIANGGITALVGSSSSDYKHWYVGGGDTIEFMGWIIAAVNPSETTDEADAGTPSAVEQYFGVLFDLPAGGPTKGAPNAIDAIRAGRCDLIYEFGTVADPDATFDLAVASQGIEATRLGLIQERSGAFFFSGLHQFGSATNAVTFSDDNKTCFWNDHPSVTAPFNTVDIQNASSIISLTNISWKAQGTKSPGTWTTTDNATVNLTTCTFTDWGTFAFDTNTTANSTFLGCGAITHGGATMNLSNVLLSAVAADTGAVVYNVAADPDGEMDNMLFSKGAAAHHAIDFGTAVDSSLTSITLRGIDFEGFGVTDDSNDSTVRFLATTGALTLNLIDCTVDGVSPVASGGGQNFSVDDAAGMTVTVVVQPVTLQITVKDKNTLAVLENVQTSIYLKDSPFTELMNEDTLASGIASESYAGVTPVDVVWKCRKSDDLDTPRYKGASSIETISSNGLEITVLLEENPVLN